MYSPHSSNQCKRPECHDLHRVTLTAINDGSLQSAHKDHPSKVSALVGDPGIPGNQGNQGNPGPGNQPDLTFRLQPTSPTSFSSLTRCLPVWWFPLMPHSGWIPPPLATGFVRFCPVLSYSTQRQTRITRVFHLPMVSDQLNVHCPPILLDPSLGLNSDVASLTR